MGSRAKNREAPRRKTRGELPTREHLLRVAERLFALEGIDAVSMRRIGAEAGQKNKSALQYHFGDKDELL